MVTVLTNPTRYYIGDKVTPKQITKFREKHFPAKNISTSRLKMAVEFRTTERTIRAYEDGENKAIPGIFVKAMELWLIVHEAIRIAEFPPRDRAMLNILKKSDKH